MDKLRFALPKGSLEKETFSLLERAGYKISGPERTYRPKINDSEIELKLLRPQEIPVFVGEGMQDVGITGIDWIQETQAEVETLLDLEYGRVMLVVAVPKPWTSINSFSELLEDFMKKKKTVRISTEYLNTVSEYIKINSVYSNQFGDSDPLIITPWWRKGTNSKVSLFLSFGATEAKPPEDAEAIVDITETGTTFEQNDLKVIDTIMESTAVFIANKDSLKDNRKREKIYDVLTLLKGVVDGRKNLHIFVNVKEENLSELLNSLPALKNPTICSLSTEGWHSVNTVIEKVDFLKLLPIFRRLAQGLVVYEPRQILPLEEIEGRNRK
jgi:ATP phosphoribosyltransferase